MPTPASATFVEVDQYAAGYAAAEHLLRRGRRRLGFATSRFYTVNLATGLASLQGNVTGLIDQGVIADIAAIGAPVPEPATLSLVVAFGLAIVVCRRHR